MNDENVCQNNRLLLQIFSCCKYTVENDSARGQFFKDDLVLNARQQSKRDTR